MLFISYAFPILFAVWFVIAIALTIVGMASKNITLSQRVVILLGAAALIVPVMYEIFIFAVILFN